MLSRFVFLCLCLLVVSGCEKSPKAEDQAPLIIITSPDNPPFEFKDTAKGGDEVIGFDMDVARKLSEYLGRPIKIMEADFSAIIPSLQSGRADMAIATLGATDERRKSIDFSDSYYHQKEALLVPESASLTSEKHLAGKTLGVQIGSLHETTGHKWSKEISDLSIVSLTKVGELVQELKNGRIQAILTEELTARKIASSTSGLKVIPLDLSGPLVIAFPKGSPWLPVINKHLKEMKKDLDTMAAQWFGTP